MAKRQSLQITLGEDYISLLDKIRTAMYLSRTAIIRKMIDSYAVDLGLDPISPAGVAGLEGLKRSEDGDK